MSGEGLDLSEGRYGFSFGFPDGNSPMGSGYVGAKYFTAPNTAVGAYLLLGGDSAAETSSFGLAGGLGLEFVLLKDFSVSGEGGFGFNTLPDGKSAYATGTGKLAVNFYY
jgi:hypothetical protein